LRVVFDQHLVEYRRDVHCCADLGAVVLLASNDDAPRGNALGRSLNTTNDAAAFTSTILHARSTANLR
jgi:hypothetical protein